MKIVLSNGGRVTTSTTVWPFSSSMPPGGKRPCAETSPAHQSCVFRSSMPVPGCILAKRSQRPPMCSKGCLFLASKATSWAFSGETKIAIPLGRSALLLVPSFSLPLSSSITPSVAVDRLGRQMFTSLLAEILVSAGRVLVCQAIFIP